MQRIFLTLATATAFTVASAGTVLAADMARPPIYAPPPLPPVYNWTGFYLGANVGGSWGRESHELFNGPAGPSEGGFTHDPDGVIGGGQMGYNWQFAPWFGWGNGTVLGLEADFQGSSQRTDHDFGFSLLVPAPVTATGTFTDRLEWFGTVRGRVGIAYDRFLPYFTGGWAYGNRTFDGTVSIPGTAGSFSSSNTLTGGWTVGGGFEWAFWQNWTAKFEYLYIDFGNNNSNINGVVLTTPSAVSFTTSHFTDNVVRAGVNYKF
jgi:outer membrane immunogenic protein